MSLEQLIDGWGGGGGGGTRKQLAIPGEQFLFPSLFPPPNNWCSNEGHIR